MRLATPTPPLTNLPICSACAAAAPARNRSPSARQTGFRRQRMPRQHSTARTPARASWQTTSTSPRPVRTTAHNRLQSARTAHNAAGASSTPTAAAVSSSADCNCSARSSSLPARPWLLQTGGRTPSQPTRRKGVTLPDITGFEPACKPPRPLL